MRHEELKGLVAWALTASWDLATEAPAGLESGARRSAPPTNIEPTAPRSFLDIGQDLRFSVCGIHSGLHAEPILGPAGGHGELKVVASGWTGGVGRSAEKVERWWA
jgi:hypothetical protein